MKKKTKKTTKKQVKKIKKIKKVNIKKYDLEQMATNTYISPEIVLKYLERQDDNKIEPDKDSDHYYPPLDVATEEEIDNSYTVNNIIVIPIDKDQSKLVHFKSTLRGKVKSWFNYIKGLINRNK